MMPLEGARGGLTQTRVQHLPKVQEQKKSGRKEENATPEKKKTAGVPNK